jgi:glycosyltransferase involved in cell wall biosynthesis
VVFFGRLSPEKGVTFLLEAARKLPQTSFVIMGEGSLEGVVAKAAAASKNIRYLGKVSQPEAFAIIRDSKIVCVPSVCHESFSLVAAEALSLGRRLVVPDSQSFHHFAEAPFSAVPAIVTNPESLAYSITTALEQPPLSEPEIALIREKFGVEGFHSRLRAVVSEI